MPTPVSAFEACYTDPDAGYLLAAHAYILQQLIDAGGKLPPKLMIPPPRTTSQHERIRHCIAMIAEERNAPKPQIFTNVSASKADIIRRLDAQPELYERIDAPDGPHYRLRDEASTDNSSID